MAATAMVLITAMLLRQLRQHAITLRLSLRDIVAMPMMILFILR